MTKRTSPDFAEEELRARTCSRWMFSSECLLAQAFPVHPVLHAGFDICSFNFALEGRKPRQVCAQQAIQ